MYVTAGVIAERYGVTKQTIWKWTREGRITHYRIGRAIRYVIEEVDRDLKVNAFTQKQPIRIEAERS